MRLLIVLALAGVLAAPVAAQSASHEVQLNGTDITGISLDDALVEIDLDTVDPVTGELTGTAASGLTVESNYLTYKISAQLSEDYTDEVQLSVALDLSLIGGELLPKVALSAGSAADVAVGLTPLTGGEVGMTYHVSAPVDVATSDYTESVEVTYTVTSTVGL